MKAFLVGFAGYPALEWLYRRRTHPAMALAGGISLKWLSWIHTKKLPLWQGALLGGAGIAALEGAIGVMLNRDWHIWDYRKMPLNVKGQVCMPFFLVWCALSAGALGLMNQWEKL